MCAETLICVEEAVSENKASRAVCKVGLDYAHVYL
jgi:hypothetical protein